MYGTRRRRGISKLAVPVAVIVILAAAGAYFLVVRSSATSSSTTGTSTSGSVSASVDQLVSDLNARNVDGLVGLYSPSAVVVWFGKTGGLSGMYAGENIRLIYATTVGKTMSMSVNESGYSQHENSATDVNATFNLKMLANSTTAGVVNATIDVSEEWKLGSAGWQITKENWNYVYFDSSQIDLGIPTATTFPQWGVMEMGGNPNLVSEKSFEWHTAPLLAAVLYAFIGSLGVYGAVRLRWKARAAHGG